MFSVEFSRGLEQVGSDSKNGLHAYGHLLLSARGVDNFEKWGGLASRIEFVACNES